MINSNVISIKKSHKVLLVSIYYLLRYFYTTSYECSQCYYYHFIKVHWFIYPSVKHTKANLAAGVIPQKSLLQSSR